MKKNNNLILAVLVVLLIACIVSPLIYFLTNSKATNNDSKKEVKKAVDTSRYPYTLNLYKSGDTYFENKCFDCDTAFTIPTESKDAKFVVIPISSLNKDPYILYDDNGLKIYSTLDSRVYKINLDNKYENYEIGLSKDNKIMGIVFYNIEEHREKPKDDDFPEACLVRHEEYKDAGMYNFKTDKIMFNDDYDYLHILDENEVVAIKQEYNDEGTTNSNTYIFNIDSGKKVYSLSGEKFVDKFHTKGGVVYHIDSGLYNSKFKKIFSSYYNVTSDGIYVMNKNKDSVSLYDANGKKLNSYKIVGDFQTLFDNNEYYLTVYNGYLYIRGLNNSFAQKVGVWKENYSINSQGEVFNSCDSEHFGNNTGLNMWGFEYFTNGDSGVRVCFNSDTKKVLTKNDDFIQYLGVGNDPCDCIFGLCN